MPKFTLILLIMKKIIIAVICTLGLIIATIILGDAVKNRNSNEDTISVTGTGSKTFTSDLITWSASFSKNAPELQDAYKSLERDRKEIKSYLEDQGVDSEEIIFSAVDINKEYEEERDASGYYRQGALTGYDLTQTVSIESKDVKKIENISRTVTEIIDRDIELASSSPMYFYTQLSEIKHQLITEATEDARQRAEKISTNSQSKLGKLKKASMGVFQITAPNSGEDYSWGGTFNTESKEKEANITVRLEYKVK